MTRMIFPYNHTTLDTWAREIPYMYVDLGLGILSLGSSVLNVVGKGSKSFSIIDKKNYITSSN